jgi:hypothetical protein
LVNVEVLPPHLLRGYVVVQSPPRNQVWSSHTTIGKTKEFFLPSYRGCAQ